MLYFSPLKEIFFSSHQDSLLYIIFFRTRRFLYSISIPTTTYMEPTNNFFLTIPPHPIPTDRLPLSPLSSPSGALTGADPRGPRRHVGARRPAPLPGVPSISSQPYWTARLRSSGRIGAAPLRAAGSSSPCSAAAAAGLLLFPELLPTARDAEEEELQHATRTSNRRWGRAAATRAGGASSRARRVPPLLRDLSSHAGRGGGGRGAAARARRTPGCFVPGGARRSGRIGPSCASLHPLPAPPAGAVPLLSPARGRSSLPFARGPTRRGPELSLAGASSIPNGLATRTEAEAAAVKSGGPKQRRIRAPAPGPPPLAPPSGAAARAGCHLPRPADLPTRALHAVVGVGRRAVTWSKAGSSAAANRARRPKASLRRESRAQGCGVNEATGRAMRGAQRRIQGARAAIHGGLPPLLSASLSRWLGRRVGARASRPRGGYRASRTPACFAG
ncbi:unnamed protein product [Urochloa humidicola]